MIKERKKERKKKERKRSPRNYYQVLRKVLKTALILAACSKVFKTIEI